MDRTKGVPKRGRPGPGIVIKGLTNGLRTSNAQMLHVLQCTPQELDHLKAVVKEHMKKPLHDGVVLLGRAIDDFDNEKKERIRDALWVSVLWHDDICSEMLSGTRWAMDVRPQNLDKHLRTVLLKIVSLHQAVLAMKKKAGAVKLEAGNASDARVAPNAVQVGRRQTTPIGPRVVEVDSDDEEMVVVREPREWRAGSSAGAEDKSHPSASTTTPVPVSEHEAAEPADTNAGSAQAQAQAPAPQTAPAQSSSGSTFNEQMMNMMIQNQNMMLQMMAEIKDLKKGSQ